MHGCENCPVIDLCEPTDFIREIVGEILLAEDDDGPVRIGKFSVFYLDIALAWSHGQSQFDVFDGYSSTFSYYEQMYTAQGEMRKNL